MKSSHMTKPTWTCWILLFPASVCNSQGNHHQLIHRCLRPSGEMAAGAHLRRTASCGNFMQSWPMLSLSDLADSCRLRRHSHSSFAAWPGCFCQWPLPVCGHLKMRCSNTCGSKARVVCRCGNFQNLLRTLSLSTPFWMLAPAMRLGAKLDARGQIMPEAVSWLACAACACPAASYVLLCPGLHTPLPGKV